MSSIEVAIGMLGDEPGTSLQFAKISRGTINDQFEDPYGSALRGVLKRVATQEKICATGKFEDFRFPVKKIAAPAID
ncbi:hypothetical protein [Pseudomonas sp. FGI182]|uniref:hypothetical protein n=1 Tax=Pseudomonas sp. FGI182 TaxID=1259844 RepID=UPI0012DD631D|nr:hypothetical protein [Pseudomonas sp. FGI182]